MTPRSKGLRDLLTLVGVVAIWFLVQRVVLPKLGIST
jgi:hypothetical protein